MQSQQGLYLNRDQWSILNKQGMILGLSRTYRAATKFREKFFGSYYLSVAGPKPPETDNGVNIVSTLKPQLDKVKIATRKSLQL